MLEIAIHPSLPPKTKPEGEAAVAGGRTFVSMLLSWACPADLGRLKDKAQIDAVGTQQPIKYMSVPAMPGSSQPCSHSTEPARLHAGSSDNSKRIIQFF